MMFLERFQLRCGIAWRIGWLIVFFALYAAGVAILDDVFLHDAINVKASVPALIGTVLALLLVFRTNTAYDRWWEGRKLWGQLVNDSRNLCIKVRSLSRVERASMLHLGRLLSNFARALKEHLREGIRPRQLTLYRDIHASADPQHVPLHVALLVRLEIARWRQEQWIDGYEQLQLDTHARALMDIGGSCERIRRTSIPPSYLAFIRQSILVYLITLPWGLVDDFGYWSVLVVVLIAYFMIGIEKIAENVEEPFGRDHDDLLLDDICRGIEASVAEVLESGSRPTVPADAPVPAAPLLSPP